MSSIVRRADLDDVEWGSAFEISAPFQIDQFSWEICQNLDISRVDISAEGDPMEASSYKPVLIRIAQAVSHTLVLAVGRTHVPIPGWYESIPLAPPIEAVKTKASQNGILSSDEIQVAMRYLLSQT